MGPRKAAEIFLSKHRHAEGYEIVLYGSLAATGKGHMTDAAIIDVLEKTEMPVNIIWKPDVFLPYHPNGMTFRSLNAAGLPSDEWTVYSVGGGAIEGDGIAHEGGAEIYDRNTMTDIMDYCEKSGRCYWEYVEQCEGKDINEYLIQVWNTMKAAVEKGLSTDGRLPGPLNLRRKARSYYMRAEGYRDNLRSRGMVFSYALAVSEENASGGTIVTAPTCGSCGVVPAVLYPL